MNRRVAGWLAVGAQFAAIAGILVATGTSDGGPRWMRILGIVCLAAGSVVLVLGMVGLGRALTPTPVPNGARLQQAGVYSAIRHPIYTGLLMVMLGVVLRSPGLWTGLGWAALWVVLYSKARWEERMLSERYVDYRGYMRRTGRFLPRIRDRA